MVEQPEQILTSSTFSFNKSNSFDYIEALFFLFLSFINIQDNNDVPAMFLLNLVEIKKPNWKIMQKIFSCNHCVMFKSDEVKLLSIQYRAEFMINIIVADLFVCCIPIDMSQLHFAIFFVCVELCWLFCILCDLFTKETVVATAKNFEESVSWFVSK